MNNSKRLMEDESTNEEFDNDEFHHIDNSDGVGFDMVGNLSQIETQLEREEKQNNDIEQFIKRLSTKRKRKRRKITNNTNMKNDDNDGYDDINDINININNNNNDIEENGNNLTYTILLDRLFDDISENKNKLNLKLSSKDETIQKRKVIVPEPLCYRVGSKKTHWSNFNDTCTKLNREISHVQRFMLAEFSTTGNLDGGKNLLLRGKWGSRVVQNVLKRYIKEYIKCHNCYSMNTILTKNSELRIRILTCNTCHSTRSVNAIQCGYHHIDKGVRKKNRK